MPGRSGKTSKSQEARAKNPESRKVSALGKAIRFFREERLMTQETLAELADLDKQRISDIERGETQTLHAATLKVIADGFGISIDELRAKELGYRKAEESLVAAQQAIPSQPVPTQILHPEIREVPGFTGREELLDAINRALWQKGGAAALTNAQSAAVHGLGGVGKSVLAREYAWRNRARYRRVWWLRAETERTLIDDLIDLGSRLIPNLKETQERDRALHLALDAIAGAGGDKPWLIVYDNVEKPGAIARLTPKTSAHILITSRWPRWQGYAQELPVDVFPEETAVDFLLAERLHETREAAGRLAVALGLLPLALSHARAYCAETNLSFDDYARRLSELIQEAPEDAEYPASVFATFSLAIAKAAEACPEAEKLMEIAAFLAPERIPLDIFTNLDFDDNKIMNERQRDTAVAALFRVALIEHHTPDGGFPSINVHRLVQTTMRAQFGNRVDQVSFGAFTALVSAFPDADDMGEGSEWLRVERIVPHYIAMIGNIVEKGESVAATDIFFGLLNTYLEARSAHVEAELLYKRILHFAEKISGEKHRITGIYANELAKIYANNNRYKEAETFYNRAIHIAETTLEKDDLFLSACLCNLARLYAEESRFKEAETFYRRAIYTSETALGKDDLATGVIVDQLAFFYFTRGRYQKAEGLYKRAIHISEKNAPKSEDFHAGTFYYHLAELHRNQGRYAEAEPLYKRAIHISEKTEEKEDGLTGLFSYSLAELYRDQGRYDEAQSLYRYAMAINKDELGPKHPFTKRVRTRYKVLRRAMASDL